MWFLMHSERVAVTVIVKKIVFFVVLGLHVSLCADTNTTGTDIIDKESPEESPVVKERKLLVAQFKTKADEIQAKFSELLEKIKDDVRIEGLAEQQHVISELREILEKIDEDLQNASYLERSDKKEIIKLLQAKKRLIKEKLGSLEDLVNFIEPPGYEWKLKPWQELTLMLLGTAVLISGITSLVLASNDSSLRVWHAPTKHQLFVNLDKVLNY